MLHQEFCSLRSAYIFLVISRPKMVPFARMSSAFRISSTSSRVEVEKSFKRNATKFDECHHLRTFSNVPSSNVLKDIFSEENKSRCIGEFKAQENMNG